MLNNLLSQKFHHIFFVFFFLIELPCLEELNATTKQREIYIHYMFNVSSENSINDIKWTKNKSELQVPSDKYRGGGVADNFITILRPCEDDKGLYTCTVWNAVGSVSKSVKLGTTSYAKFNLHLIFINI